MTTLQWLGVVLLIWTGTVSDAQKQNGISSETESDSYAASLEIGNSFQNPLNLPNNLFSNPLGISSDGLTAFQDGAQALQDAFTTNFGLDNIQIRNPFNLDIPIYNSFGDLFPDVKDIERAIEKSPFYIPPPDLTKIGNQIQEGIDDIVEGALLQATGIEELIDVVADPFDISENLEIGLGERRRLNPGTVITDNVRDILATVDEIIVEFSPEYENIVQKSALPILNRIQLTIDNKLNEETGIKNFFIGRFFTRDQSLFANGENRIQEFVQEIIKSLLKRQIEKFTEDLLTGEIFKNILTNGFGKDKRQDFFELQNILSLLQITEFRSQILEQLLNIDIGSFTTGSSNNNDFSNFASLIRKLFENIVGQTETSKLTFEEIILQIGSLQKKENIALDADISVGLQDLIFNLELLNSLLGIEEEEEAKAEAIEKIYLALQLVQKNGLELLEADDLIIDFAVELFGIQNSIIDFLRFIVQIDSVTRFERESFLDLINKVMDLQSSALDLIEASDSTIYLDLVAKLAEIETEARNIADFTNVDVKKSNRILLNLISNFLSEGFLKETENSISKEDALKLLKKLVELETNTLKYFVDDDESENVNELLSILSKIQLATLELLSLDFEDGIEAEQVAVLLDVLFDIQINTINAFNQFNGYSVENFYLLDVLKETLENLSKTLQIIVIQDEEINRGKLAAILIEFANAELPILKDIFLQKISSELNLNAADFANTVLVNELLVIEILKNQYLLKNAPLSYYFVEFLLFLGQLQADALESLDISEYLSEFEILSLFENTITKQVALIDLLLTQENLEQNQIYELFRTYSQLTKSTLEKLQDVIIQNAYDEINVQLFIDKVKEIEFLQLIANQLAALQNTYLNDVDVTLVIPNFGILGLFKDVIETQKATISLILNQEKNNSLSPKDFFKLLLLFSQFPIAVIGKANQISIDENNQEILDKIRVVEILQLLQNQILSLQSKTLSDFNNALSDTEISDLFEIIIANQKSIVASLISQETQNQSNDKIADLLQLFSGIPATILNELQNQIFLRSYDNNALDFFLQKLKEIELLKIIEKQISTLDALELFSEAIFEETEVLELFGEVFERQIAVIALLFNQETQNKLNEREFDTILTKFLQFPEILLDRDIIFKFDRETLQQLLEKAIQVKILQEYINDLFEYLDFTIATQKLANIFEDLEKDIKFLSALKKLEEIIGIFDILTETYEITIDFTDISDYNILGKIVNEFLETKLLKIAFDSILSEKVNDDIDLTKAFNGLLIGESLILDILSSENIDSLDSDVRVPLLFNFVKIQQQSIDILESDNIPNVDFLDTFNFILTNQLNEIKFLDNFPKVTSISFNVAFNDILGNEFKVLSLFGQKVVDTFENKTNAALNRLSTVQSRAFETAVRSQETIFNPEAILAALKELTAFNMLISDYLDSQRSGLDTYFDFLEEQKNNFTEIANFVRGALVNEETLEGENRFTVSFGSGFNFSVNVAAEEEITDETSDDTDIQRVIELSNEAQELWYLILSEINLIRQGVEVEADLEEIKINLVKQINEVTQQSLTVIDLDIFLGEIIDILDILEYGNSSKDFEASNDNNWVY